MLITAFKMILILSVAMANIAPGAYSASSFAMTRADRGVKKDSMVRVCVARQRDEIYLSVKGRHTIETLHTGEIMEASIWSMRKCRVSPTNSGIQVSKKNYPVFGIRIVPMMGANIYVNKRRFRGILDIIRTEEMKLTVINHVDVEDYLYGVLYYEMPHYWPTEALKAQAIAARTFAMYRKEERKTADYDVTSDAYSQVYGGKSGENWRSVRAVKLTKGKVLKYKGKIVPAYYHSVCGGHTEDANALWNVDSPCLKGKSCRFCRGAPYYKWKAMYSYKQIEEKLNNYGIKCKDVSYIASGPRDKSGRVKMIKIRDTDGVREIPANEFRLALGGLMLKSTKFALKITRKGIIFRGRGWGHGVGMCQWGAFGMAKRGSSHRRILEFYYPGAKIEEL